MTNTQQKTGSTAPKSAVVNGLNQNISNSNKVLAGVMVSVPNARQKFVRDVDYAGMEVATAKMMPKQSG